jgi:protein gp37
VEKELNKRFKPGEFIFVAYMGDISFATREEVMRILDRINDFPETNFLIQSKNPWKFWDWQVDFPRNVYLGTTIETNRDYYLTKAPPPLERFRMLTGYGHNLKFLSIEPIMDIDLDILTDWVRLMNPDIVEIGADNYHNHLVEPPWWKVESLINNLRDICPKVVEKEGLERLKLERR